MFYNLRTTYGEVGILDMPSAHMAPDGELSFTVSAIQGAQRYNASFQMLKWLDASFRYSHVIRLFGSKDYYDRSFGMKIRLLEESQHLPDLSVGFRDILGTGIYSGEYLVASKHLEDFDVTLGVGWGRFAESNALPNPLASLFSSFKTRAPTNQVSGTFGFQQWFHGPKVGLFGGLVWRTPIDNLNLLVEYSSDRYDIENGFHAFKTRIPVNVGMSYRAFDAITLSAGWFYGTSYGATVTFSADPTIDDVPMRLGPSLPQPNVRADSEQARSLTALLSRTVPLKQSVGANVPWVNVASSSNEGELALIGALLNEGVGVQNAEKARHTLLVEAALTRSADAQCDSYAKIAAGFDTDLDSVAVSDMHNASGNVVFCNIARRTNFDAPPDDQSHTSVPNSDAASIDPDSVRQKILRDVGVQAIRTEALSIEGPMLWLYFSNGTYRSEAEAAGRIARVLMADAPASVEVFHLVSVKHGLALRDFQIARSALERATSTSGTARELGAAVDLQLPLLANSILDRAQDGTYPRLHWSVGPGLREGLFDPDRPLQVQIFASADANLELTPRVTLEGRVEANVFNNFNFTRLSNSELPHVRSDALLYFRHGANGLADLMLNYRNRLAPDVYVEAKAGYLETMFVGAGGQVLWRPESERFAIGADIYQVWQRNFDRLFGFQSYHVLTGHVSVYYASPWYGLNFNVHAGRFLAGDYGATFEITRRFSTGVEIGAFATFTNVPFAKFGEGSFDKGIMIHIPFEWALPFFSQSGYDLTLRSLTRDGGQRLYLDDSLYEETRPTSFGEVEGDTENVISP